MAKERAEDRRGSYRANDPLRHLWLPYTQMQTAPPPLAVAGTEGVRIVLEDGRELIDAVSSWWTACHGYNHPHIRNKVSEQLAAMPHVMMGGMVNEPAIQLAERLAALLPGDLDHVFFSESGSVSVEIALKMAVQVWLNRGVAGRTKFIGFRHGYHGDTAMAMSVTDPEDGMHQAFDGFVPRQIIADLPRNEAGMAEFDRLLAAEKDRVAAVIMEPLVQCAGGMKMHGVDTLAAIAECCRRHGVLLILDEIATAFGRTGSLFACDQAGIVPDIITLSKSLTGGTMALAATVASREVYESFLSDDPEKALMHGPTFTGNPLACAAANASLDLFESESRLEQVAAIETHLKKALAPCRGLPGVVDVRIKGAIGAVQLEPPLDTAALRERFVERGIWLRPFGDVVYTMPPFIVSQNELSAITDAMVEVVTEWSAEHG